ncbi:MAG: coniferyl aldehyde dehydrogenase [Hydrocarboniphaga sp.]|uniref:coniferyl aldehyde dehydrogenase n=1 Tax=Hydrocarboniphaga sp. TaxID=2033016 RepID=UPI002619B129|nr:coniferyl aldehyde dehydrogenase [Hydrocarboniphaga sp.]MDB5969885.1 coniferyl aldehyde dehydrogenase [Hydrocarboniphaga sp.]
MNVAVSQLQVDAEAGLLEVLKLQRTAFLRDGPPSATARENRIDRLMHIMLSEADRLVEALDADYGSRSRTGSYISDVLGPLPALKHTRKHLRRWMKSQSYNAGPLSLFGGRAWVEWQPLGVVGVMSPWNFPVGLAFAPVAAAFAAGNRVMLKVSEFVPATSELMRAAVAREFDPAELALITGGPEIGAAFSRLPFDHLLFTGATSVGRHVQRAAADNLVPVTLELGGKSPVVVSPKADLQFVAQRVMAGKSINAGQLCLSPDYMLVPAGSEDELIAAFESVTRKMFPTLLNNDDFSSIVAARHFERLNGYIDDARAKGARVVTINPANEDFSGQSAHKIPPTLLVGVNDEMKIASEETFGPLLSIISYRQLDEAIEYINSHPKPLAAYYFGPADADRRRFIENTYSGGVTLNDVILHHSVEDMPFGGVGASGMGNYHGRHGFETFSHGKSIVSAPKAFSPLKMVAPPYGERMKKFLNWQIRREASQVEKRLHR